MKIIKTNRDIIAWIYTIVWLISNIIVYIIFDLSTTVFVIYGFIFLMMIIIFIDRWNNNNNKFNKWLNTYIKS